MDCAGPVERLALNWRTGELLPWEQAPIPGPAPTPSPPEPTPRPSPGPDLAGEPLYTDPAGRYRLYTGPDRRGLWCVPAEGEPVLWVEQGNHFFYIP